MNNTGKSTQLEKLFERIREEIPGPVSKYVDPVNSITSLSATLKDHPEDLSPRETQFLYALRRTENSSELKSMIEVGPVVTEDYIGTSYAWGISGGVDIKLLWRINTNLLKPDITFLLYGTQYTGSIEKDHKNKIDDSLYDKVSKAFRQPILSGNWIHINNRKSIDEIHEEIWSHVKKKL